MFVVPEHRNLRVIQIASESLAIVHPSTGAFAFLDGKKRTEALVERLQAVPQDHRHLTMTAADPEHPEIWEAITEYRNEAVQRELEPLDTIILKVTNRCNEACKHCYDACGHDEVDMTADKLCAVVDEALALSGPHLNLLFHGGEPFLRSDLLDEVAGFARKRAKEVGKTVGCYVQTNASVLNERLIDMLQRNEFSLGISIDGWESLHDELRVMQDGSSTYRLFKRTYDRHRDFLVRNSGILTTVMASNVDVLDEVAIHIRDLGFTTWNTTLFDLNGRGALFPHLAVDPDRYCAALERIMDRIEVGEFDNFAIKPLLTRLDNLLLPQKIDMCLPGNGPCGAGTRLMSVSAEGTFSGCDIVHDRNLTLGQSPADTLSNAMASPRVASMQNRLTKELAGCHSCTWLGVCGGTCLARGGLKAVDPIDCRISKLINEAILKRLSRSDSLLEWYAMFPPERRKASIIQDTQSQFVRTKLAAE